MKDCGVKPAEIDKIVVAKGPGSYTGVRIGVTIAKTLAWTLNKPLVGVSSLEVYAASAGRYFKGVISPLFDARRGQIYTGLYQYKEGQLASLMKDQILLAKDWAAMLSEQQEKVLLLGMICLYIKRYLQNPLETGLCTLRLQNIIQGRPNLPC